MLATRTHRHDAKSGQPLAIVTTKQATIAHACDLIAKCATMRRDADTSAAKLFKEDACRSISHMGDLPLNTARQDRATTGHRCDPMVGGTTLCCALGTCDVGVVFSETQSGEFCENTS